MKERKEMRLVDTGLGRLGGALRAAAALGRKKMTKRITAGALALSMVLTNVGFSALAAPGTGEQSGQEKTADGRVADPGTLDDYDEILDMTSSTENAGRVWTDKSVFTDEAEVDGNTYESENGDYVEVFSAMGSSQQYEGVLPSKTVIVFDNSGSMYSIDTKKGETWATSRIAQTVEAINSTIDRLMEINPDNEVAVVLFGDGENRAFEDPSYTNDGKTTAPHHGKNTAVTIIPMGRYDYASGKEKHLEYLKAGWLTEDGPMGNALNQETPSSSGWVFVDHEVLKKADAETANGANSVDYTAYVNGTTNIQAGIYRGLQELYTTSTSKDEAGVILHYIPSMLVLTDGQATDCLTGGWTDKKDTLEGMGFVNDFSSEFVTFTGYSGLGSDTGVKWNQFLRRAKDEDRTGGEKYEYVTIGGKLNEAVWTEYQEKYKTANQNYSAKYNEVKNKAIKDDGKTAEEAAKIASADPEVQRLLKKRNDLRSMLLPEGEGLAAVKELSDQYRSTEGYMVLGTLVTASYWQNKVAEKFGRACNIYTISVDMPDPKSENFTLKLDETTGKANASSDWKITTNGPMMNPGVCFSTEWLKKYFVSGNLDGETIYPADTIGSQRVLGIWDAIKAAQTENLGDTLTQYRDIDSGKKPEEVKTSEDAIDAAYADQLNGLKEQEKEHENDTDKTKLKEIQSQKKELENTIAEQKLAEKEGIIKDYNDNISHGNFWVVGDAKLTDCQTDIDIANLNLNYVKKAFYANSKDSAADAISNIFDEIVTIERKLAFNPISSVQANENGQTNPNSVLTYTDPIGKYMEVKGVDSLLLFGKEYKFVVEQPANEDGSVTYKPGYVWMGSTLTSLDEENSIIRNDAYDTDQKFDVRDITATVSGDAIAGTQILKIIVPARALPILVANLTPVEDSDTYNCEIKNKDVKPLRVIYRVGLAQGIKSDGVVDLNKVDETYKSENQDGNGGVNFYTNLYTGGSGNAKTEFTPNGDNRYYNYVEGNKHFEKKDGDSWEEKPDDPNRSVDKDQDKSPNKTETSEKVYDQKKKDGKVDTSLGNNGRTNVSPAQLDITKIVEGGTANAEDMFDFILTLTKGTKSYDESLRATVGVKSGRFFAGKTEDVPYDSESGGYKFSLKAGETIRFNSLPIGYDYTVVETGENYNNGDTYRLTGITRSDGSKIDGYIATGTAAVGKNEAITFTNQRLAELKITKQVTVVNPLVEIDKTKTFAITVTAENQPDGIVDTVVATTDDTDNSSTAVVTGTLEFKNHKATVKLAHNQTVTIKGLVPGTYSVAEEPLKEEDTAKGYKYEGIIPEGSSGELKAGTASDRIPEAVIVNSFNPQVTVSLEGTKFLDRGILGEGVGKEMKAGEFTFVLSPETPDQTGDTVPAGGITAHNDKNGRIVFENIVYTVPGTYTYYVKEMVEPNDTTPGIIHDNTQHTVVVEIAQNEDDKTFADPVITVDGSPIDGNKGADTLTFNNVYNPDEISVQFSGRKTMDGAAVRTGDFSFKLTALGYQLASPANAARERRNSDSDGSGTGAAARSGISLGTPSNSDPSVRVTEPDDLLRDENGNFVEQDLDGQPMPAVTEVTNNGEWFWFDDIRFTQEGVYRYQIEEVQNSEDPIYGNITFDKHIYEIELTVNRVKDGEGNYALKADWDIVKKMPAEDGGDPTVESWGATNRIEFHNVYNPPEFEVHKNQRKDGDAEGTRDPYIVVKGDVVTYTLTVGNTDDNSNGALLDVTMYDRVPEGLILLEDTIEDDGGSHVYDPATRTITWYWDKIEKGVVKTVTFQVRVPDAAKDTTYMNTGFAYTGTPEPHDPDEPDEPHDPEKQTETVVLVEGVPEINIEKTQKLGADGTDGAQTKEELAVKEGDVVTYYLTVTSSGTETAENVVVTDVIPYDPKQLELVEGSISDGGTSATDADGHITITWNLGDMAGKAYTEKIERTETYTDENGKEITVTYLTREAIADSEGAAKTVSYSVTVPDMDEDAQWRNIGLVTYDNPPKDPEDPEDPENPKDPEPKKSNEVVIVSGVPHVSIEKEQSRENGSPTRDLLTVKPDEIITYYLSVTSDGVEAAKNVRVTDQVPEGLEFVDAQNDGQYDPATGIITWELGDMHGVGYKEAVEKRVEILEDGTEHTVETLTHVRDDGGKPDVRTVTFRVKAPAVNKYTKWVNEAATYYDNPPKDPDHPDDPPKGTSENPIPSNKVEIDEYPPHVRIEKEQSSNRYDRTKNTFTVYGGDVVTYYLTVYSDSENDTVAKDVTVQDVVPQYTTQGNHLPLQLIADSISDGGVYDSTTKTITWKLGDMPSGTQKTVTFQVTVPHDAGTFNWINAGTVFYQNPPEDPENPDKPQGTPENPIPSNEVEIEKRPNNTPPGNPGNPGNPDNPGTEIPDNPTPLANFPGSPVPLSSYETIEDEDVPLAYLAPMTGDNKPVGAAALFGLLALGMMGAFGILGFKKKDEEA